MKTILKEEFDQHDCHLSEEDSCSVCEKFYSQDPYILALKDLRKASLSYINSVDQNVKSLAKEVNRLEETIKRLY